MQLSAKSIERRGSWAPTSALRGGVFGVVALCGAMALDSGRPALACSCVPPPGPTVNEALTDSVAVFLGVVSSVEHAPPRDNRVTLQVTAIWKGVIHETIEVFTPDNCAACGLHFEIGEEAVIYAFHSGFPNDETLHTGLCMRSTYVSTQEDVVELGPPCAEGDELSSRDGEECEVESVDRIRRGDSNGDKSMDVSDAVFLLNYMFLGGDTPGCLDAADANDSGDLDLSDGVAIVNILFLGHPLSPGFGDCREDVTPDELTCVKDGC